MCGPNMATRIIDHLLLINLPKHRPHVALTVGKHHQKIATAIKLIQFDKKKNSH